jgi:hypothetical protein
MIRYILNSRTMISMSTPALTHDDLTAQRLLDSLPPEKADVIRKYSLFKGQSLVATLKESLLKTADQINASVTKELQSV